MIRLSVSACFGFLRRLSRCALPISRTARRQGLKASQVLIVAANFGSEGSCTQQRCADLIAAGYPVPDVEGLGWPACQEATVRFNLAVAHAILGDAQSIGRLEGTLSFARENCLPTGRLLLHLGLARMQFSKGDAEYCLLQALEQPLTPDEKAQGFGLRGELSKVAGELEDAEFAHKQALDISRRFGLQRRVGHQLCCLGRLHLRSGNYDDASNYFGEALDVARATDNKYGMMSDHDYLGLVLEQLGELSEAAKHFHMAEQIFEAIWRSHTVDMWRRSHRDKDFPDNRGFQRVLLSQQRPWEALLAAERTRARAFSLLLAEQTGQSVSVALPRLQEVAKKENAAVLYFSLLHDEEFDFASGSFSIWALGSDGACAGWARVENAHGIDGLLRLAQNLRPTSVRAGGDVDDLEVDGVRGPGYGAIRLRGFKERAGTLYDFLIKPIEHLLAGEKNLVIVPEDFLFFMPWAALFSQPQDAYLVELFSIRIVPSLSVLGQLQLRSPLAATGAVIASVSNYAAAPQQVRLVKYVTKVDDLGFSMKDGQVVLAELPSGSITARSGVRVGWSLHRAAGKLVNPAEDAAAILQLQCPVEFEFRGWFDDLPGAAKEAQDLCTILEAKGVCVRHIRNARRSDVLTNLSGARFIHVAAHCLWEKDALVLADEILSSQDIYNMKLRADLVVLSACDSGRGELSADGVVGLGRAFLSAGASTVVLALTPVHDKSAPALMASFYDRLLVSCPAVALQQAVVAQLRSQGPDRLPGHWAPFFLMGRSNFNIYATS